MKMACRQEFFWLEGSPRTVRRPVMKCITIEISAIKTSASIEAKDINDEGGEPQQTNRPSRTGLCATLLESMSSSGFQ